MNSQRTKAWVPLLFLISSLFLQGGCRHDQSVNDLDYYTWDGLEPDKWASVWLLENHTNLGIEVQIVPVGAEKRNAVAIDTPTAKYKRIHGKSTYESIYSDLMVHDAPVLVTIGRIIHDLEVNPWNVTSPLVAVVEQQFRALQEKYNRVGVPTECYTAFFNQLYVLVGESDESDTDRVLSGLNPDNICALSPTQVKTKDNPQVFEYAISHLLQMIDAGKQVVFVDTREDEEFDEQHIPGAINIKLREVSEPIAESLQDADIVISYCIKDFRGYEVALALNRAGLRQSGIMKPYGIKGWKDRGLPVASDTLADSVALTQLKQCAANGGCS